MGDNFVKAIKIKQADKDLILEVQGVFVEIGAVPGVEFIDFVARNNFGEIKIDAENRTNVPGIFAAGDVTDVLEKQIIIAAGEGAKAVLSVFRYLSTRK